MTPGVDTARALAGESATAAMEWTYFSILPVGEHQGWRIEVCPKCGRPGRVQLRLCGGRTYDHVARPLEPAVGGVHLEIVEWCEVFEPLDR